MDIRIQVPIEQTTPYGTFHDALYFTPAEYAALTEADIEALKQARVDAWVAAVSTPRKPAEPTAEDLAADAARVRREFEVLAQKLATADSPELDPLRVQVSAVVDALAEADAAIQGEA